MTRWARSGNSQKHQKMPEDPTPWEELVINTKKLKKGSSKNKSAKEPVCKNAEKSRSEQSADKTLFAAENKNSMVKFKENENILSRKHLKTKKKRIKLKSGFFVQSMDDDNVDIIPENELNEELDRESDSSQECFSPENDEALLRNDATNESVEQSKKDKQKLKRKRDSYDKLDDQVSLKNLNESNCTGKEMGTSLSQTNEDISKVSANQQDDIATDKRLSRRQLKKLKRESKMKQDASSDAELPNQTTNETEDCPNDSTTNQLPPEKKSLTKKERFQYKLLKKRAEVGIQLLPPKVERKLYLIKKRLREKGFTGDMIKDIIRKERRKAELKLRKYSSVICFNCRQTGHVLADCSLPASNNSKPEVGICFKCGSTEHMSSRCRKQVSGYPFASCFVCKKSGHISRDCPDNKHGVYIRGGKCGLCGNINHYRKDCPSLRKKEKEETSVHTSATVHTIFEGKSIDDEITDFRGVPAKQKKFSKTKIVKF